MKLATIIEHKIAVGDVYFNAFDDDVGVLFEADKFVRNSDGFAVAMSSGMATKALKQYMSVRRKMIARFHATTQNEKNLYKAIVKDLLATKQYSILKSRMVGGGWLWELQRKQEP